MVICLERLEIEIGPITVALSDNTNQLFVRNFCAKKIISESKLKRGKPYHVNIHVYELNKQKLYKASYDDDRLHNVLDTDKDTFVVVLFFSFSFSFL